MNKPNNQSVLLLVFTAILSATLIIAIVLVAQHKDKGNNPTDSPSPTVSSTLDPDNPDQEKELPEYVVYAWVKDGETTYESRTYTATKHRDYYIDGKYESTLAEMASYSTKALQVDDFTTLSKDDISADLVFDITEIVEPSQPLTWEATIDESEMHVLCLIAQGYTVRRQAVTPTYCEIYLQNEDNLKRVVIFKNSLMTSDVSNTPLPDISTYFE